MGFIIKTIYLLLSLYIGGKLYIWIGGFKGVSQLSPEQVNEDRIATEYLDPSDIKNVNKFGLAVFLILSTLLWSIIGLTIGKIAAEITYHKVFRWFSYILMYFFFLRVPLGVLGSMLKEYYEIEKMPEQAMFSILSLTFYILAICCYDSIPMLFKWHLYFLN